MKAKSYTLRDLLKALSVLEECKDVSVDGTDFCIAVEGDGGIRLTPEAEKHFAPALKMPIEGCTVMGLTDDDYDAYEEEGKGRLALAVELLRGVVGYCSNEKFERWFEGEDAKLI